MAQQGAHIACRAGCSGCCRGLFDITLLDAWYLKTGFDRLDQGVRETVLEKCRERLAWMRERWPELDVPYLLNYRHEDDWELLMPEEDETPCVLLSASGGCLLYDHRPMTCRLHGIPVVDSSGEAFYDEWCTLNFTAVDPLQMPELRGEFNRLFKDELALFKGFTSVLLQQEFNELDTFIPLALLMEFD
jgi:Fe-S-cluster containining protein